MKNRVLIIQNDPGLCAAIKAVLCETSMIVDTAYSSSEAIDLFLRYDYSIVLLDTGTDRKEIVKPLRAITSIPILALCGSNDSKGAMIC